MSGAKPSPTRTFFFSQSLLLSRGKVRDSLLEVVCILEGQQLQWGPGCMGPGLFWHLSTGHPPVLEAHHSSLPRPSAAPASRPILGDSALTNLLLTPSQDAWQRATCRHCPSCLPWAVTSDTLCSTLYSYLHPAEKAQRCRRRQRTRGSLGKGHEAWRLCCSSA